MAGAFGPVHVPRVRGHQRQQRMGPTERFGRTQVEPSPGFPLADLGHRDDALHQAGEPAALQENLRRLCRTIAEGGDTYARAPQYAEGLGGVGMGAELLLRRLPGGVGQQLRQACVASAPRPSPCRP